MLAIIVPFYKIAFFEATLKSLVSQTDKRFKVYIGDDCSPDDCGLLLKEYDNVLAFEYCRFEKNLGGISLVQQWQRCIALAKEEQWFMILGDDDVLGPNVVASFYSNLEKINKHKIDVVRFATQKIAQDGSQTDSQFRHPEIEIAEDFLIRKYEGKTRSSLSEYIFSKKRYSALGFRDFPLAWYSDVFAVLEFSDFGTIFTINEAVVSVRYSDLNISSITTDVSYQKKKEAKRMFTKALLQQIDKFFKKREILQIILRYYKNDKKDFSLFLKLSVYYLCRFRLKEFFYFLKFSFSNT